MVGRNLWILLGLSGVVIVVAGVLAVSTLQDVARDRFIAVGSGSALVLVRPDGSDLTRRDGQAPDGGADWSPEGGMLAYSHGGEMRLLDTEREGAAPRTLGRGSAPAWSPDGQRLAYVDGGGRAAVSGLSGAPGLVTRAPAESVSWSADGTLLTAYRGGIFSVPSVDRTEQIASIPGPVALWSNDGRYAYVIDQVGLVRVPLDGTEPKRIVTLSGGGSIGAVDASPSGKRVVIEVADPGGGQHLELVNTDTGDAERLIEEGPPIQRAPSYSPDAARLAFVGAEGLRRARPAVDRRVDGRRRAPGRGISDVPPRTPAWEPPG